MVKKSDRGWHEESRRHSDAATKGAKHRHSRKHGRPIITKESHKLFAKRDSRTGEFEGWSTKPPKK